MRTEHAGRPGEREGGAERGLDPGPVDIRVGAIEARLGRAIGRAVAIDREPRAVRSALAHLGQHAGEQPAELLTWPILLEEQPDDAAHGEGRSGWDPKIAVRLPP